MALADGLVIAQYMLTALSSGFNAVYFIAYRSEDRKHQVGAAVLAVLSLALLVESVYFGVFAMFGSEVWAYRFFFEPERWFLARMLLCLSSVMISALILRQMRQKGR